MIGAHYDSFGGFGPSPGADDNASGTAGLLELARLLAGPVMVTDTAFVRNPNYHGPGDTAETLDYERMARMVEGVANAATNALDG